MGQRSANKQLLILAASLLVATSAQGALSCTAAGTNNSSVGGTTFFVTTNQNMPAGSMGILVLAFDNAGSGGSTKILSDATFTDSAGNTWTRRLDFIYDAGAANAGVEMGLFTGNIVTQLNSGQSLTVNFSTSVSAKTGMAYYVTCTAGNSVQYVTGAAKCDGCTSGQTGTAAQITTSTMSVGDMAFGASGWENNNAPTLDTDTTNGTWSCGNNTQSTGTIGLGGQFKVQTTTSSTQSIDHTNTSSDWQFIYVQLREVAPPSPVPAAQAASFMIFLDP